MEKSLAEEKQLRVEETQKLKESAENTGFQLTSVQHELEELTKKTDTWLKELCRINSELRSKFLILLFLYRHPPCTDIGLILVLEILYSGHFPHSQPATDNVTRKARAKRAKSGPVSAEWSIDDHLSALGARISPMKSLGVGLLEAAIRVYTVLWPTAETPASVDELSRCLQGAEKRLREWRASAARVGADEALIFVLSWYENIDLNILQSTRAGSKWTTDPEHIRRRQEVAHAFI